MKPFYVRHPVQIRATGCYLPELVLDNDALIQRFGLTINSQWIVARTGIHSRHWLRDGETTSDMCVAAAKQILDRAGVLPSQVDRLILATGSPDYPSPSTATIVARKLGARCAAFDLSAACAGFLYGLDLGMGAITMGAKNVLVIAADARSRYLNPKDRRSLVLFADGAGGALLTPGHENEAGFLSLVIDAEGRERMGAHIPAGGAARPTSQATLDAREHYIQVDGKDEIFDAFVGYTREICARALADAALTWNEIDLFITHQGNALLVDATAKALGLNPEKVVNTVAYHGNTSGATVPIALTESIASGRIQPGSRVLLTAVGAGCTFGAAIYRF